MSSDQGQTVHVSVESVSVGPVKVEPVKVEPVKVELTRDTGTKPLEVHKAEVALLGKIQGYSTEVLRISLFGIAVLGFFFERVATLEDLTPDSKKATLSVMGCAAALFAVAAAASLAHRYYSTNALSYSLEILKGNTPPAELHNPNRPQIKDRLLRFLIWRKIVDPPTCDYRSLTKETSSVADIAIGLAAISAAFASFTLIVAFFIARVGYEPKPKPAQQPPHVITLFYLGR
jgi:hypothetical protein